MFGVEPRQIRDESALPHLIAFDDRQRRCTFPAIACAIAVPAPPAPTMSTSRPWNADFVTLERGDHGDAVGHVADKFA